MSPNPGNPGQEKPPPHFGTADADDDNGPTTADPSHPVNCNLLNAEEAETAWIALNR